MELTTTASLAIRVMQILCKRLRLGVIACYLSRDIFLFLLSAGRLFLNSPWACISDTVWSDHDNDGDKDDNYDDADNDCIEDYDDNDADDDADGLYIQFVNVSSTVKFFLFDVCD